MSQQEAKRFADALENDPRIRARVKGAWEHIVKVAKDEGYSFTDHELHDEMRDRWGASKLPKANETDHPFTCFSEPPAF
jgi:predicted ribosomally synthesized peptide with nif11-like leader